MSSGTINQVYFNDGEGVVYSDFNTMQTYALGLMLDQVVGGRARISDSDFYPSNGFLFSLGQGGAAYATTTPGRVGNKPGMILQYLSSSAPSGTQNNFLAYQIGTDEVATTFPVPDTTNHRIDGLFLKLYLTGTNVQQRDFQDAATGLPTSTSMTKTTTVALTSSVVTGALSAGWPTALPLFPSTPAGYVPLCYVYQSPATSSYIFTPYPTSLGQQGIYDWRVPLGLRTVFVPGTQAGFVSGTSDWTSNVDGTITARGTLKSAYMTIPMGIRNARLVGIRPLTTILNVPVTGAGSVGLVNWTLNGSPIGNGGGSISYISMSGNITYNLVDPSVNHLEAYRCAVWGTGRNSTQVGATGSDSYLDNWAIKFISSAPGDIVHGAIFYIAE